MSELQSKLATADEAQRDAAAAVERLEGEMQDLAGAYNNLEVQSYQLEAHIKRLQNQSGSQLHQSGEALFYSITIVAISMTLFHVIVVVVQLNKPNANDCNIRFASGFRV